MAIFRRMLLGRTAGAFLFAFILLTPSAAGACATTSYSYAVTYTPLKPALTPPTGGTTFTYNYFEPRNVSQSSMASLPSSYNTATQFDNGTGLATSSQSRPATLDASSVTYSYQIDQGANHWHDTSFNHVHVQSEDHLHPQSENHWHDQGYWEGGFVPSSVWVDTSHTAYNRHRNRNAAGSVLYACDIPHTHDSIEGDCGGHTGLVRSHDNRAYWHSTGYWGVSWSWSDTVTWNDTSYNHVHDTSFNHVHDTSFNHWHDQGENHWHPQVVTVTGAASLPTGAFNVTYNANYVAQDQYIGTSRVPAADAYQITYNYVVYLTGCTRPT